MLKKSQISVFLIISIMIVVVLIVLTYLGNYDSKNIKNFSQQKENLQVNNIKSYLDSCFINSYYNSLYNVAFHSGNFDEEDIITTDFNNFLNFSDRTFYFYVINNMLLIPNLNYIKSEIERGIIYNFNLCLNSRNSSNLIFDGSNSYVNIRFLDNFDIVAEGKLNVVLNESNLKNKISFSSFYYRDKNSSFISLYETAKEIALEQQKHPDKICLNCINDLTIKKDFIIYNSKIFSNDDATRIFTIFNKAKKKKDVRVFIVSTLYIKNNEGET